MTSSGVLKPREAHPVIAVQTQEGGKGTQES